MHTVSFYLSFMLGKMARSVASGEQWKAEQVISVGRKLKIRTHCLPAKRGYGVLAPVTCCCLSLVLRWIL